MDRFANLVTLHDPKNPIAEAFRTLRTNIQFASVDQILQTIMVTSVGPSEGKSTIISNLASVMAQTEKKFYLWTLIYVSQQYIIHFVYQTG